MTADTPQDYGSMYYMDYESAEEISVETAAMGAEIGGGGGANINIIPKSRGNDFKGNVYFTGANDDLAGDNVDDRLRAQGIARGTSLLRLYDTNATTGGPIKKDRVWWFGAVRHYRTYENVIGFPKDFKSILRNYSFRTNFQLSPNNNLSAFWTHNTKIQPNRGAGVDRPTPEATWAQQSPKNLENLNWTSALTPRTFLEVSSSMFRMYWPTRRSQEWRALATPIPPSQDITTGIFFGAHTDGQRFRDARRLQVNAALTHYRDRWLGGSHQFKAGYEMWHGWGNDRFEYFGDTRYRYRNGVPAEIFIYNTPLTQQTHMRNFAGFVQDRASHSRFTLNLGLRYAFYDGWLPEQEGGGGRWFPRTVYPRIDAPFNWSNFAPRLGVVVRLSGDGRNVVKVSYGRYFEHMYTWHFASAISPNIIRTTGVATQRWFGNLNGNGIVDPAFRRQAVPGSTTYKGLEFSVTKRMSSRWQLMGSYVWSRLEGLIQTDREVADPNNPSQQLDSHKFGRGVNDQPHAFKLVGSYQAPYGIDLGVNLQVLSGLPRDRTFRTTLRQGSTTVRAPSGAGHIARTPSSCCQFERTSGFASAGARRFQVSPNFTTP